MSAVSQGAYLVRQFGVIIIAMFPVHAGTVLLPLLCLCVGLCVSLTVCRNGLRYRRTFFTAL